MKELETHLKVGVNSETRTELNVKKQQEIEYFFEGTLKPKKGHFIWEINEETGEVKKAEYKQDTVEFNIHTTLPPEKIITNHNCVYIPALNARTAKNKYLKNPNQSAYYLKPPLMNINDLPI